MVADSKKILLVDDDKELLKTVGEVFQLFGFSLETAEGGHEAWQKLQKDSFDLVISDIRMQEGDGIELLGKCKSANPLHPKFLIMSGFADSTVAELYDKGVDGFFSKPFDSNAVRIVIKESLQPLQVLWSSQQSSRIVRHYHKKWQSLNKAIQLNEIQFGRKGFFMPLKSDFPEVGQTISFEFDVEVDLPISMISGYGKVLWKREQPSADADAGIGVLIQYINEKSLQAFVDWLEEKNYTAVIPYGRKVNNHQGEI